MGQQPRNPRNRRKMSEIKKCPHCGKEMPPERRNKYCSSRCYLAALDVSSYRRACIVCGKEFRVSPTTKRLCCSRVCSKARRNEIVASNAGSAAYKKMQEAFQEYRKIGTNHHNAKHYLIRDPQGNITDVINLRQWVYSSGYFESPYHAYDNFKRISSTLQGTSVRTPQYTYKGWSIVHVDDGNRIYHQKKQKICAICGKVIENNGIKYCSAECRNEARRMRQRKSIEES